MVTCFEWQLEARGSEIDEEEEEEEEKFALTLLVVHGRNLV